MKKFFVLLLTFILTAYVNGADESASPEVPIEHPYQDWMNDHHIHPETDSFYLKFLNMLFILALVITFMILGSWMVKRLMRTRLSQMNQSCDIKIIESRSLSTKATVHLLEVRGKVVLIAESASGISYLATVHAEEKIKP